MAAVSPIPPPSILPYATSSHAPVAAPAVINCFRAGAVNDPHDLKSQSILGQPRQRHRRAHVRTTQLAGASGELRWPRNRIAVLATEGQRWAEHEDGFRVNSPLWRTFG